MSGGTLFSSDGKELFTKDKPAYMQVGGSDIQVPVQIQSRLTSQIQTHNNTLIAPNAQSESSGWLDCSKFDKLAFDLVNDASTNTQVYIYWSFDGATKHGKELLLVSDPSGMRASITDIKAPYYKVAIQNMDSATAHTLTAFTYLKS